MRSITSAMCAGLVCLGWASIASADVTLNGNLNLDRTWDRTLEIPLIDSSNDGVPYQMFLFRFDAADDDIQIEITEFSNPGDDTTLYLFHEAWDVNDPMGQMNNSNAMNYDDDTIGLLSAIGSIYGDGPVAVSANETYGIIVSGFNDRDRGDFTVNIRSSANITLVPEPTGFGIVGLISLAWYGVRRRHKLNS